MNCDAKSLLSAAVAYQGMPKRSWQASIISLLCQWASAVDTGTIVVIPDGSGGFWRLMVDTNGNVGTTSHPGPKTADVILADGSGGFWKLVVSTDGLIGAETNAGPATVAPTITDGNGTVWTIIVATDGMVGMQS